MEGLPIGGDLVIGGASAGGGAFVGGGASAGGGESGVPANARNGDLVDVFGCRSRFRHTWHTHLNSHTCEVAWFQRSHHDETPTLQFKWWYPEIGPDRHISRRPYSHQHDLASML